MREISKDLIYLLRQTEADYRVQRDLPEWAVQRYDKFSSNHDSEMNDLEQEIYWYFWDFVVDDAPFYLLEEAMDRDLEDAITRLSEKNSPFTCICENSFPSCIKDPTPIGVSSCSICAPSNRPAGVARSIT